VSLCPLLSSSVCPLSLSTSHCSLLILCLYNNCRLLQSARCLLVPRTVPSVGSVSLCPLLSSSVCPLSASTSHCSLLILCLYNNCRLLQSALCLLVPHTVPFVVSLSLYPLLPSTVCPQSVRTSHFPSLSSVSLYTLLSATVCPLSDSSSHCSCCHQTADRPAAITYSTASQCQLWQTWPYVLWFFGNVTGFSVTGWPVVCGHYINYIV